MNTTFGRCRILQPWPDWNNSIHTDDAQIQRQGWAMTYSFSYEIDYSDEAATFSSTSDLPYYKTSLHSCTCYDFQKRRLPCKHIYRLAVELKIIEIISRPTYSRNRIESIKLCDNIDSQPEQMARISRAKGKKCAPLSVDYVAKAAIFFGSGKEHYKTTIDSCTCRDYFVRRLPCKHIYRLRMELEKH